MPPFDCVILDYDGVLVDSADWFDGVLNEVARRFGFRETTADERLALRGLDTREVLRRLEVPLWKLPSIARHMRGLAIRDAGSIAVFPGVPEALERLRARGVVLALVTSNSEANVRRSLGGEVCALFDHQSCGASLLGKARRLRRMVEILRVEPGRAAYVGDELRDVEAARSVGLAPVAVTWGYGRPDALAAASPVRLLSDVEQLDVL